MEAKTNETEKRTFGALYSGVDVRDYKMVCTAGTGDLPEEFELETGRIKNQGAVGSCVAHALSSIVEYYNFVQRGDTTEMSTGYIYGNRSNSQHKGAGMVIRDALAAVLKCGDVPKKLFPENVEIPVALDLYEQRAEALYPDGFPNRITAYCRISTAHEAKLALSAGAPLLMAMDWYEDMQVVDGLLTTCYAGLEGGHCMFIYGWESRGWKVQNSWGGDWGTNGTFVLPYSMGMDECWAVMDSFIDGAEVEKPFSSKIGNIIAKVINAVIKIFDKK